MSDIEKLRLKFDQSMRTNYAILGLAGLYPFENKTRIQKLKTYICTGYIMMSSYFVIWSLYDSFDKKVLDIVEKFGIASTVFGSVVKYFYFLMNGKKYGKIIRSLRDELYEEDSIFSAEEYKPIVKKYHDTKKIIIIIFRIASTGCHIVFSLSPILIMFLNTYIYGKEFEYIYPFNMIFPVPSYYVHYLCECFAEGIVNQTYLCCSMLHLGILTQLYIHISCLGKVIEKLVLDEQKLIIENHVPSEVEFQRVNEEVHKRLQIIIKRHIKVIEVSAEFQDVASPLMLLTFFLGSIFICFCSFILFTVNDLHARIKFSMFLFTMLVTICDHCYFGQLLIDVSGDISDALYSTSWYMIDYKMQKTICIMLHRSQKPMILSAMGYVTMNFETFCSVLGTSWSWFTLLQTIYEP